MTEEQPSIEDFEIPVSFRLSLVRAVWRGTRGRDWVRNKMAEIGALEPTPGSAPESKRPHYTVNGERLRQHFPDAYMACAQRFIAKQLKRLNSTSYD